MKNKRRVALIIETSSSYGRSLLAGIVRFRQTQHEWSVFLEQRDLTTKPPAWLDDWKGHGIISRATTPQLARAVAATGVPLVELTDRGQDLGFPHVWSDDAAIGKLAAEHLLERGFRNFGFCGFKGEAWSDRRETGFVETVQDAAAAHDVYTTPWHGTHVRPWEEEQHALMCWLRRLPKPAGIMACNDVRGQHVLEACSRAKLTVPEEVAVIGVDDDQLLCQLCDPPLSSVIPNAELIGFRSAELLSDLMARRKPKQREYLIAPLGIATRQSTDVVAIDDKGVAAALSYIREHACSGISVQDVLDQVPVSRSTLERQLRKYLKRSPQQEIRHVQLKRARDLLAVTDLPLERIASLCGFKHPEYMHVVFRRELKTTPGEYRRTAQP
jgi:LacI family transcriptional regulator